MKRRTIFAAILTPVIGGGAGVLIAQQMSGAAAVGVAGPCAAPTVYIDIAGGSSLVTGGPDVAADCDSDSCSVRGAEQVQVQAGDRLQCVAVGEGQAMALTHRGDTVSIRIEDAGR